MVLGYQIGEEIGEGAQASVRLGYKDGQYVAIKILQKQSDLGVGFVQTLDINAAKKEFKIHNSVSHQNIIKVFGCAEDGNNIYIILEYAAAGGI